MKSLPREPGFAEFVALAALLISLVALSIDAMLPALSLMARDLSVADGNQRQWIVTVVFLGLGLGQLLWGPISDAVGRRPAILGGLLCFLAGSLLCLLADDFPQLLLGRWLQGLGAASPRIVTVAMVRDRYSGVRMARVMSVVMAIFILVPALAPLLGQGILLVGTWHDIFLGMLLVGLLALGWFAVRQPETLAPERRRRLAYDELRQGVVWLLRQPQVVGSTLVMGLVFATFVAYLSTVQQILGELYGLGERFPFAFAVLALAIGLASFVSSRLVLRLGMVRLCRSALTFMTLWSALASVRILAGDGHPDLEAFFLYSLPLFFSLGLLFGNLNALALEPAGHLAGLAASLVGATSTLIAVPVGMLVAQQYAGHVLPLTLGFALFGAIGWGVFRVTLSRSLHNAPST